MRLAFVSLNPRVRRGNVSLAVLFFPLDISFQCSVLLLVKGLSDFHADCERRQNNAHRPKDFEPLNYSHRPHTPVILSSKSATHSLNGSSPSVGMDSRRFA